MKKNVIWILLAAVVAPIGSTYGQVIHSEADNIELVFNAFDGGTYATSPDGQKTAVLDCKASTPQLRVMRTGGPIIRVLYFESIEKCDLAHGVFNDLALFREEEKNDVEISVVYDPTTSMIQTVTLQGDSMPKNPVLGRKREEEKAPPPAAEEVGEQAPATPAQ